MTKWLSRGKTTAQIMLVVGAGVVGYFSVPLGAWSAAAPGLFVMLSVFAAAALVRLARPSPISNPDVFSAENLDSYFDTLKILAQRLTVIFAAVGAALTLLTAIVVVHSRNSVAVALSGAGPQPPGFTEVAAAILSAAFATCLAFVVLRFVSLIAGDIGFIELQRRMMAEARFRKANDVAQKRSAESVAWQSPGGYGRVA